MHENIQIRDKREVKTTNANFLSRHPLQDRVDSAEGLSKTRSLIRSKIRRSF